MPSLPVTEWTAILDRMTYTLGASLTDLDRYESDWAAALDEASAAASPEKLFEWLERRIGQWDAKLAESAKLAAAVETELDERRTALGRWFELFANWQDLIQRGVNSPGSGRG